MRINKHVSVASAAFIFMAFYWSSHSVHATPVDGLENVGFETGDLTGWNEPSSNPNPWSVVSNNPHTGDFSAYNPPKNTAIADTTIYQIFAPTLVDNITTANFWYFHEGGPGTIGLATRLRFSDGTSVQDTLYAVDPSYKQNQWVLRDLKPTLLAFSGKYLVEIGFFSKSLGSQYVDDVSIIAVPEPATVYLYAIGLVGLMVMRWPRASRL